MRLFVKWMYEAHELVDLIKVIKILIWHSCCIRHLQMKTLKQHATPAMVVHIYIPRPYEVETWKQLYMKASLSYIVDFRLVWSTQ